MLSLAVVAVQTWYIFLKIIFEGFFLCDLMYEFLGIADTNFMEWVQQYVILNRVGKCSTTRGFGGSNKLRTDEITRQLRLFEFESRYGYSYLCLRIMGVIH